MTIPPQAAPSHRHGVDNAPSSSTPCGSPNVPLTSRDAFFSTIHSPYYYCYLFYL
jgi:hypothetical protein